MKPPAKPAAPFTSYQKFVIAMLAFLQFTIVLDFMILSPLGALLMHDLSVPTSRFGLLVSIYAFSAGASGLLAAGFADRFDRKKLLLFFYAGFVLGTVLCGVAPGYHFLLFARMVTGLFGGVIGSIVMTIIVDLFPLEMRGRVMGFVMTAFAASQVLGIPLGLYLSAAWGWHAPFLMIAGVAAIVGVFIAIYLKPVDAHLALAREPNPFRHLFRTVSRARYLQAFAATTLLVTGGFMLMPFGSAFSVHNMGIPYAKLPTVYLVTGIFSMIAGPLAGRLSDAIGKYGVFCAGSVLSMILVAIYTRLGITPLWELILISVVLFVGISARMISASALMSAVPDAKDRGAFMSVNASIQQVAGGVAAAVAGVIVVQGEDGVLHHYEVLGYVVITAMILTMGMLYFIDRGIRRRNRPPMAS